MGINVRQLEITVQQLEAQLNIKTEQVKRQDDYIAKAAKETQAIVEACRKFCMILMEQEITYGNVTSKELQQTPLIDLLKLVQKNYADNQVKTKAIYDQFAQKLEEKANVINGLQSQNSQLQIQLAQCVENGNTNSIPDPANDIDLQRQTAYLIDSGKNDVNEIKPALNQQNELEQSSSVNDFAKSIVVETSNVTNTVTSAQPKKVSNQPMVVNYEDYKSQMTPLMWLIIKLMGTEGLCEFPEIKTRCLQENASSAEKVTLHTVNAALNALKNMKAISSGIKINTGIRWFYVYEFEELGYRMFVDKFKKPPIESEIRQLVKEHDNIKHGYYIKEASNIIKEKFDYTSVSTSRKANYIKLANGKASIPDIICAKPGMTDYYEVECGNHQQGDFNDKCNKLKMITSNIYFIVPDIEIMNKKLAPQIEAWIKDSGGRKNLIKSNVTVYLTTMKRLLEKEWAMVYDMTKDEPIILNQNSQ